VESLLTAIATWISQSQFREVIIEALMEIPGLPPVVQAIHILGIAVVVGAFVIPLMKVLGIAAHQQLYGEMLSRLRPWAWGALCVMFLSGAVFVIARPFRYFFNPIFGIKFGCLLIALTLTLLVQRQARLNAPIFSGSNRTLALIATIAWTGVIFSGRWIAYVDYLFWEA